MMDPDEPGEICMLYTLSFIAFFATKLVVAGAIFVIQLVLVFFLGCFLLFKRMLQACGFCKPSQAEIAERAM